MGGLFIFVYIFILYKSLYGKGVKLSLIEVFDFFMIDVVEFGLSCDIDMVLYIFELNQYMFLINFDVYLLVKIGREYNELYVQLVDFIEFVFVLRGQGERIIIVNYGLDLLLGKYYQMVCEVCGEFVVSGGMVCVNCGNVRFIKGVSERLCELSDQFEVCVLCL